MLKEHDVVLVEGTIVHIYPGMGVCEVEFSNPETLPGNEAVVILPLNRVRLKHDVHTSGPLEGCAVLPLDAGCDECDGEKE